MNHAQIKAILDGVLPVVKEAIAVAQKPLLEKIAELEARKPEKGEPGAPGKAAEIDYDKLGAVVAEHVSTAVAALPKPENGKDADAEVIARMIDEAVARLPAPAAGKDADPAVIERQVAEAVAKLPTPAPGQPGKSVDPAEVAVMVDGAVERGLGVLASTLVVNDAGVLVHAFGGALKEVGRVRGADGAAGASLMDGELVDGELVLRLSDGRKVKTGIRSGKDGDPGRGDPGPRGRDAHELQILPAVDPAKSYAEGVVAAHAGGLIRADRQTDAVVDGDIIKAGWRVILEGIADVSETVLDEGRIIERTTTFTGGRVVKHTIETASVIDRGVWTEREYLKGDGVTWAGSFFIAQRKTSGKPELSPDWRLAVKRGRDGKNGDQGKQGPVGPAGPKGPPGSPAYSS